MKMLSITIKYRLLIITMFIIIWSIIAPSKFQKGGIEEIMYYVIYFLIFGLSFLYVLPVKDLILIEKILFPLILSFIGLFITTIFVMDRLLNIIYSYDYEIKLWDTKPRIISNLIYYFLTYIIVICPLMIYSYFRKEK